MRLNHSDDLIFTTHMVSNPRFDAPVSEELHYSFVNYAEPFGEGNAQHGQAYQPAKSILSPSY